MGAANRYLYFPYLRFPSLRNGTCVFHTYIFQPYKFILTFAVLAFFHPQESQNFILPISILTFSNTCTCSTSIGRTQMGLLTGLGDGSNFGLDQLGIALEDFVTLCLIQCLGVLDFPGLRFAGHCDQGWCAFEVDVLSEILRVCEMVVKSKCVFLFGEGDGSIIGVDWGEYYNWRFCNIVFNLG